MKVEVLLYCNKDDLSMYETSMITAYDTLAPRGYNCSTGGETNKSYCEETRRRTSETMKEGYATGRIKHVYTEARRKATQTKSYKQKRIANSNGSISIMKDYCRVCIPSLWSVANKAENFVVESKEKGETALKKIKEDVMMNNKKFDRAEFMNNNPELAGMYTNETGQIVMKSKVRSDRGVKRPLSFDELAIISKNARGSTFFDKKMEKYRAIIPQSWCSDNKQHMIGSFVHEHDAQNAIDEYYNLYVKTMYEKSTIETHDTLEAIKLFKKSKNQNRTKRVMDENQKQRQSVSNKPTGSVRKHRNKWYSSVPKWWSDTNKPKIIGSFDNEQDAWDAIKAWKIDRGIE